ncbi:UV DNA damage repair endonuclease UvsE, partial [Clostridium perfringens]|nr:UV DNA damage repair endonuclease UvsE [Clostridium perfringens]
NDFNWQKEFKNQLDTIGEFIKKHSIRVSMHPGQYTVINSPKEEILEKSLKDIEYHCNFLDSLNLDYKNKIVLHIGGVYGDKILAKENFIKGFNKLSKSSKNRLVIENDEKNFSLDDILDISNKINIPVIFDNLHNTCFGDNSYSLREIYSLVSKTWNENLDGNIKVHYSQQDIFKKKGSHSPSISINEFLNYYNEIKEFNPDIMLEVKDKDVSSIKCINSLKEINNTLSANTYREEMENYKLLLFQHDRNFYNTIKSFSNNLINFYSYLDELLLTPNDNIGFKYSLELAFNIIEDYMSKREITHFKKIIKEKELEKAKLYLKKISKKIEVPPKELAYYFSRN